MLCFKADTRAEIAARTSSPRPTASPAPPAIEALGLKTTFSAVSCVYDRVDGAVSMNRRPSTPLPDIPYAIAPKNKFFDQVNMQKDTERPQVSKATGKWKDFGKREWDPVGGNWKTTPSDKKSPDIPERSDRSSTASESVPAQSRQTDKELAQKRSFGQITTDRDANVPRPQKRRSPVDTAAKIDQASRASAAANSANDDVHERGRSREPQTQHGRTIKREQSLKSDSVRQQSTQRDLSKNQKRAFLYGSTAPNVGIEAATAALRQAREKKEISQKTGIGPIRRDSAVVSEKPSVDRGTSTASGNDRGSSKIPFIEDEDSEDALRPVKTAGKIKSVNESLFVSTSDPVESGVQEGHNTPPRLQSSGNDAARRSGSLTQRSPIKIFRPTGKYSSPLGTKLDEPRSTPDLRKAAQALSEATSDQQTIKAQGGFENLQKKQLGGYLHLPPKYQKPLDGEPSQQGRTSSTSAVDKAEDELNRKMAKAATAMQRVMQKPLVNTSAIAAQAKAGAQSAVVPKLTATGFTFEKPGQARPMQTSTSSAVKPDSTTNKGPTSLRHLVDSRENIRELNSDASKKTGTKHRARDRSQSHVPSSGPPTLSKLGNILGEDAKGNLTSEDEFILCNADQGWVARKIADQLGRRHGIKTTPSEVRRRYDELRGTRKGIPLRESERGRRSMSQAPSTSNTGDSERGDEGFELDGDDTEDEDADNIRSVPGQSSFQQPREKATLRPTTGGKSPSCWKFEYQDALTAHDSDEEGEEEDLRPVAQSKNRIYNVYIVYHRVTAADDPNPEDTEPDKLEQAYYDLSQANTVAQQAAFGGDFQKNGSLSWDLGEDGHCTWSHIHGDMITTTWVNREERLLVPADPQPDESVNIIGRTVWDVKEEVSQRKSSGEWQVVSTADVGAICSSLRLANKTAANHLLER